MSLLVVGSVAIDTVETPRGRADDVLGGAATYFAVAASFFAPVQHGRPWSARTSRATSSTGSSDAASTSRASRSGPDEAVAGAGATTRT